VETGVTYKIGEVAAASGVTTKTIRYYESIGLLDAPQRAGNGYRTYQPDTIDKLRFVHRARGLGFGLDQVRSLLALWADEGRASAEVKALALDQVAQVELKIAELQNMRDTLMHLVDACHGDDRPNCPILDELTQKPE
jgi:MerR family transcriptional regulator, copper efflux regulator